MTRLPLELSSYVDGEVSPERRDVIEQHLASCPDCAATVATYRSIGAAVRRSRIAAPYRPYRYAGVSVPPGTGWRLPGALSRVGLVMASVVAMVLLVLGVSLIVDHAAQRSTAGSVPGWPIMGGQPVDVALEGQNAIAHVSSRGQVSIDALHGSPWALTSGSGMVIAGTVGPSGAALEFLDPTRPLIPLPLGSVASVTVAGETAVATGLAGEGAPPASTSVGRNRGAVVAVDLQSRQVLWQRADFGLPPPAAVWLPGERVAVVDPAGAVALVNGHTGTTITTASIADPVDPLASCLTIVPFPGGYQRLALVNASLFIVDLIDIPSFTVVGQWRLAGQSGHVGWLRTDTAAASSYSQTSCVVSPDGKRLYIASSRSPLGDALVSVDTATGAVTRRLSAPNGGFGGLAVTSDGRWLYASAIEQGRVLVLDAETLTPRGSAAVGSGPRAVVPRTGS